MFLQWCRDVLILSFIFVQRFRFVGQDAASKRHHCRNTNVGRKVPGQVRPMRQTVTTIFLVLTTSVLLGQSNDIEFYNSVDKIKTVSELTRTQDKLKLAKQHADSLNYGIIQTNWIVKKWKKYSTTYLVTLSVDNKIFYSEFYRQYLTEDFDSWYDKKLHVRIDSSHLNDLNKIQNKHSGSNIDFDQLTRLPDRGTFGYGCFVSGTMPEDGIKMLELVKSHDTTELIKWLKSISPVKQTYSYLGLKLLQVRDSVALTADTMKLMQELESSSNRVYSCSGCTVWDYLPIKTHLTADNVNWFIERNKKIR